MEQYMMYEKAILFQDQQTAEKILGTDDVAEIKALGRMVRNFDEKIWREKRVSIVHKGVLQKFLQNPELAEKLLETGEQMIAECAVKDKIWGIGLSMWDEERFCVDKWKGQNLLGKILMQVRAEISVQNQNTENSITVIKGANHGPFRTSIRIRPHRRSAPGHRRTG